MATQTPAEMRAEALEWLAEYDRAGQAAAVLTEDIKDYRRMALHLLWLANRAEGRPVLPPLDDECA